MARRPPRVRPPPPQIEAPGVDTKLVERHRGVLLAHRDRWGRETAPTRARLDRLTAEEAALYDDLVTDRLGDRLRLEQERIAWGWAQARFP